MGAKDVLSCICVLLLTAAFIGWMVVVVKYACVVPFRASVDEASLARLALTAPGGGNGTPPAAASLAYDLSLVVALRSNSRAMGVISRAAPLDAELRFLDRPFARAQLAGAEWEEAISYRGKKRMVYLLAWKGENASLALGPNEVAAFAMENATGVFELQLVVVGKFKVNDISRWCRIRVSCALRLKVSTAAAPAPFSRVECAS